MYASGLPERLSVIPAAHPPAASSRDEPEPSESVPFALPVAHAYSVGSLILPAFACTFTAVARIASVPLPVLVTLPPVLLGSVASTGSSHA